MKLGKEIKIPTSRFFAHPGHRKRFFTWVKGGLKAKGIYYRHLMLNPSLCDHSSQFLSDSTSAWWPKCIQIVWKKKYFRCIWVFFINYSEAIYQIIFWPLLSAPGVYYRHPLVFTTYLHTIWNNKKKKMLIFFSLKCSVLATIIKKTSDLSFDNYQGLNGVYITKLRKQVISI